MLKENVLEILEKEYPKGFVIQVMRDGNSVGTEMYNPERYLVLEDSCHRLSNCAKWYADQYRDYRTNNND
jgi:hypothetical protein